MSSILDALKKADRESVVDDGKHTPWPRLPAGSSVDGPRRGHLWIVLGVAAVFCVAVSVFWFTRRPESDPQPIVARGTIAPRADEKPRSVVPPTTEKEPAKRGALDDVPPPPPVERLPQKKTTMGMPAVPAKKTPPPPEAKPEKKPASGSPSAPPLPAEPARQPVEVEKRSPPSRDIERDEKKVFRSDERIELQALVWAPDAADRFVVINNLLLREGGSFENIKVIRINPDDVLLSEGADRWYQEFKIR